METIEGSQDEARAELHAFEAWENNEACLEYSKVLNIPNVNIGSITNAEWLTTE